MRWIVMLAVVFVAAAAGACRAADDHKQSLIQQFPFHKVAKGRFAPVYPAVARQLVRDYGIRRGVCVDVGGARGALAVALAQVTDLTANVLDLSPAAVRLCDIEADEAGLTGARAWGGGRRAAAPVPE